MKQTTPDLEVILMTDYGTVETAVEAMRLGAFDFITKPLQHVEMLLRVRNALRFSQDLGAVLVIARRESDRHDDRPSVVILRP